MIDNPPPHILNPPKELERLHRLIRMPTSGEVRVGDVPGVGRALYGEAGHPGDRAFTWYFLASLYGVIRLDKDAVELFAADINQDVETRLWQAPSLLATAGSVDVSKNPWFHTLQGIQSDLAQPFEAFIESFKFRRHAGGVVEEYGAYFQDILVGEFPVRVVLTHNITRGRRLVIVPGNPAAFSVVGANEL